ncbi:MAG: hypothetical protein GY845_00015, partial [Planctomycetes bacterium]|nr:hypothetical protein [Planctomycetota bacterium]
LIEAGWRLEQQNVSDIIIWNTLTLTDGNARDWFAMMVVHNVGDDVKRINIHVDLIK